LGRAEVQKMAKHSVKHGETMATGERGECSLCHPSLLKNFVDPETSANTQ